MFAIAAVLGLLAVFVAQTWLASQSELRAGKPPAAEQQITARTIVVAVKPLKFGAEVTAQSLREVPWPEGAVLPGMFGSIGEIMSGGRRVVLSSFEPNEPLLASKITGPGQRATLSAMLAEGMKAVTIRVNDVDGVAGFVLPGDHVDVLMTRQPEKGQGATDIVLQNVRVVAIDQIADRSADKPTVAKAVTIEVDATAAQKVALASNIGSLSLALRRAGESKVADARRVTASDLAHLEEPIAEPPSVATITVTRATERQTYSVPTEGVEARRAANAGRRHIQQ
jgi:pilus assembly protein CpaB